jgi:hypothetical protein
MKNLYSELILNYVDGWKQNNLQLIKECLTDDCIIIESHGPQYQGISDVERWFKLWLDAKSKFDD